MKFNELRNIMCYGFRGQNREYVIRGDIVDIDELNENNCCICNTDDCNWDYTKGTLMAVLDDKEPITLKMLKQKRIELEDKERFKLLRELRDKLLAETDYMMNPDYPHKTEEKKQAWKDYRQALRDLPDNSDPKLNEKGELDMDSITLPLKPY
jgi:hypothetical protein